MKIAKGDIYQLGDHRLMCGDSTDASAVARLIGDEKIRMILTDPPYGVAYVEGKADLATLGHAKVIENDQLQTEDEYRDFTARWLGAVKGKLATYNTLYCFNSDLMYLALRQGIEQAGWYYSQMLIWIKSSAVIGRKDYLPQHELCAYGWYGRHKTERSKGKSVMFHPKPARAKLHPTMKPVGLLRKLLLDATKIGDSVYDAFGGSGSTLIACAHTKRRCFMMEMDPVYVETIIARWEQLTGDKAKKI